MVRNTPCGFWTEKETNWSKTDTEFIKDAIAELYKESPTSYEALVERNEAKLKELFKND